MKDRIAEIIHKEGLTAQQFAKNIGVPPASISHIFAGRNQPSRKFLYAIMDYYKDINPEWLMFGTGNMYRNIEESIVDESVKYDEELTSEPDNSIHTENKTTSFFSINEIEKVDEITSKKTDSILDDSSINILSSLTKTNEKVVDKIIIIYSDKTFEVLNQNI